MVGKQRPRHTRNSTCGRSSSIPPVTVPFNRPYVAGPDVENAITAMRSGHSHGDGPWTARATEMLRDITFAPHVMLTTSCTSALDLAALLLNLGPGDEVIVPSFTFVSTANAVAMRGATPVFLDVREDTFNLDESLLEAAVTGRTKAVFLVHYGGIACAMDVIGDVAGRHGLAVVEDNAHGLGARQHGQALGTFGVLATQSFHDTKNVHCGEGGALLVNDGELVERTEILREKGTNRSRFLRGQIDKYTWVDLGSSFLPSDVLAAYLVGQLEALEEIQALRHRVWDGYARALAPWARDNAVMLPTVPEGAEHPAHVFALLMPAAGDQGGLIEHLHAHGVGAAFHYVPLHSSPAGRALGRTSGSCAVTTDVSARLVRLPLFPGLTDDDVGLVIDAVTSYRPGHGVG